MPDCPVCSGPCSTTKGRINEHRPTLPRGAMTRDEKASWYARTTKDGRTCRGSGRYPTRKARKAVKA